MTIGRDLPPTTSQGEHLSFRHHVGRRPAVSRRGKFSPKSYARRDRLTWSASRQLSSLPTQLKRYTNEVADFIDLNVEKAASYAREALSTTPWIKDYIKFKPPPAAPAVVVVPLTTLERTQAWIARHKLLTGAVVVVFGATVYYSYKHSRFCRKTRRAKRARNGGRVEVVVIAGSPTLPLTRSLSLDMERRGFIVYVVCNAVEDEAMVHHMARPDIRPLTIDITDVSWSVAWALRERKQYG